MKNRVSKSKYLPDFFENLSAFPEKTPNQGFYGPLRRNRMIEKREERSKEREQRGKRTMQLFVFILATLEVVFE